MQTCFCMYSEPSWLQLLVRRYQVYFTPFDITHPPSLPMHAHSTPSIYTPSLSPCTHTPPFHTHTSSIYPCTHTPPLPYTQILSLRTQRREVGRERDEIEDCHWNFGPGKIGPGTKIFAEKMVPWTIFSGKIGPTLKILVPPEASSQNVVSCPDNFSPSGRAREKCGLGTRLAKTVLP